MNKGIIYCITNEINGKKYIGQTRRTLERRWKEHCWRDNDQLITRAIKKYGKGNFNMKVLEKCDKENLNNREMYWIAFHNTYEGEGYNTHKGGRTLGEGEDHPRTGQKTPEEVKEKMRQTLKENGTWELRQGKNHPYYGKKHTKEIREKMSGAQKNSPITDKEKAIKIIKKYYNSSKSQRDLAKRYNCCANTIARIINGKHFLTRGLEINKFVLNNSKQLSLF